MNKKIQNEIYKNGPFIAEFINQKGEPFYKGYKSPFLRKKAINKMKYAGVKFIGKQDYQY